MELPDQLHCLFSATVEQRDGSYVVEVPEQEVRLGDLQHGETCRVAVFSSPSDGESEDTDAEPKREREPSGPPVTEGEQRTVEIEELGDQGDGLARVDQGFVVIVPETKRGERVIVEITDVRETVAFADVIGRASRSV
ncbi:TRAM domain-containing protein [Halorientalis brevis]|uniref:TRAM domain-containing protein n=1 Tax=Halorientalis brevis TaxID=1126241 RepID=A0ABD6CF46_9EURY|nr:TRAM domain-containing protein [Halorientalis brevis]